MTNSAPLQAKQKLSLVLLVFSFALPGGPKQLVKGAQLRPLTRATTGQKASLLGKKQLLHRPKPPVTPIRLFVDIRKLALGNTLAVIAIAPLYLLVLTRALLLVLTRGLLKKSKPNVLL